MLGRPVFAVQIGDDVNHAGFGNHEQAVLLARRKGGAQRLVKPHRRPASHGKVVGSRITRRHGKCGREIQRFDSDVGRHGSGRASSPRCPKPSHRNPRDDQAVNANGEKPARRSTHAAPSGEQFTNWDWNEI